MGQTDQKEIQEARGAVYGFFSGLLGKPLTPDEIKGILCEESMSALRDLFQGCIEVEELEKLHQLLDKAEETSEDLFIEYKSLFRVPGERYIHPYESAYRSFANPDHRDDHPVMDASVTKKVNRIYKTEGLALSQGFNENADHLSAELEFMAYLCAESAECLKSGKLSEAEIYNAKQGAFFRDHLSRWAGECLDMVRDRAGHPFYRLFAALLREYLKDENNLLGNIA